VLGFDLLYGRMGRISFGHMLYLGAGAYGAAMSAKYLTPDPFLAILMGIAFGAAVGVLLGPIVVKTKGAAFALINVAFNQIGYFLVLVALARYTGGEDGVSLKFSTYGPINFGNVSLEVEPGEMLVDVLRERLGLTGTKAGCREGECGVCSVVMNGVLVAACIMPVKKAQGATILTIEGLEAGGELDPVQKRFIENGAIQCGFCTPAMVLAGKALLDKNPRPTREEIQMAISGILCRCTGYQKIIKAIDAAASGNRGEA
jgi:carbon-monoxide dehydrogenase small subunit